MTGRRSVQFFFGLGSRYSYLAATQIPKLAAETGVRFHWRPLHSRELIARAGPDPFRAEVERGQYAPAYRTRDAVRWAKHYGVAYVEPVWEGVDWKVLALACIAADRLGAGEVFATALFARCFGQGLPPRDEKDLLAVAASVDWRLQACETRQRATTSLKPIARPCRMRSPPMPSASRAS
jgi:2-hydroxychromene-2-carboxylate isomerase